MNQTPGLEAALAACQEPQATVQWCASLDSIITKGLTSRGDAVDAIAEEIRLRFMTGAWDFGDADHAINMLAGYAQRQGEVPSKFWQIYLIFDEAEYGAVDEDVLRAKLARLGTR